MFYIVQRSAYHIGRDLDVKPSFTFAFEEIIIKDSFIKTEYDEFYLDQMGDTWSENLLYTDKKCIHSNHNYEEINCYFIAWCLKNDYQTDSDFFKLQLKTAMSKYPDYFID